MAAAAPKAPDLGPWEPALELAVLLGFHGAAGAAAKAPAGSLVGAIPARFCEEDHGAVDLFSADEQARVEAAVALAAVSG